MGLQLQLLLTAYIVNFGLTPVQLQNEIATQAYNSEVNDASDIQENFQNLFDSVAKNRPRKSESYREILKRKVAKEQQAFDGMKEELKVARDKNFHKKRHFHKKIGLKTVVRKREAIDNNQTARIVQDLYAANYTDGVIRDADDDLSSDDETATPRKRKYGTTLNWPLIQDAMEKKDKTVLRFYRNIVERTISLFWGQQEQLLEIKLREKRIREKTKGNFREFFEYIQQIDDFIRRNLDLLADKFWNPKLNLPDPIKVESVRYFESMWDKMEIYVNKELEKYNGTEVERNEVRDFLRKAKEELPVRFEDLKKDMNKLVTMKLETRDWSTTEGSTAKEWILPMKNLRRNDTRRASIQR